jgi:hypothetical protein
MAYFINPPISVPARVSPTVARKRLGENVTAAMNTQATIEESLDASSSMRPLSYQRKVCD